MVLKISQLVGPGYFLHRDATQTGDTAPRGRPFCQESSSDRARRRTTSVFQICSNCLVCICMHAQSRTCHILYHIIYIHIFLFIDVFFKIVLLASHQQVLSWILGTFPDTTAPCFVADLGHVCKPAVFHRWFQLQTMTNLQASGLKKPMQELPAIRPSDQTIYDQTWSDQIWDQQTFSQLLSWAPWLNPMYQAAAFLSGAWLQSKCSSCQLFGKRCHQTPWTTWKWHRAMKFGSDNFIKNDTPRTKGGRIFQFPSLNKMLDTSCYMVSSP